MPRMSTLRLPDPPDLREALAGVRGLLLDLDGVVVSKSAPIPGAPEAIAALDAARFPYAIATNISLVSRTTLREAACKGGHPDPGRAHRQRGFGRRRVRSPPLPARAGLRALLARRPDRVRGSHAAQPRRGRAAGREGRSRGRRRRRRRFHAPQHAVGVHAAARRRPVRGHAQEPLVDHAATASCSIRAPTSRPSNSAPSGARS